MFNVYADIKPNEMLYKMLIILVAAKITMSFLMILLSRDDQPTNLIGPENLNLSDRSRVHCSFYSCHRGFPFIV